MNRELFGFCDATGGAKSTKDAEVRASGLSTTSFLLRYADEISVVVNVNSNGANAADLQAVVETLHDIAAGAR